MHRLRFNTGIPFFSDGNVPVTATVVGDIAADMPYWP
jgi:hypothetical protein